IECIAPPPPTAPLAIAGTTSLDASGYAILYTYRILSNLQSLINAGAGRQLRFATYQGGRSTTPAAQPADFIISKAFGFYAIHEFLHTGSLGGGTGGQEPTGTGNFLDAAILTKVDSKTSGFNTFYIPTLPESVTSLYKTDYLVK